MDIRFQTLREDYTRHNGTLIQSYIAPERKWKRIHNLEGMELPLELQNILQFYSIPSTPVGESFVWRLTTLGDFTTKSSYLYFLVGDGALVDYRKV